MAPNLINPNVAANAYSNSQSITGVGQVSKLGSEIKGLDGNDGVSFSDLIKENVQQSLDVMKSGEEMSAKAITGEADLTDVVQAITSAEITLQTVVAVRDKMISAYQDIMRMPI